MYTGCFSHFSFSFSFYDISKGVAVHWIYHETCKWNTFKNTLNCVVKRCNYFFLNIEDERRAAEVNRLGQMKALLSHDEHDHPMENVIHNYLKRRRYHLQAAGGLTGCNETDCFFFHPEWKRGETDDEVLSVGKHWGEISNEFVLYYCSGSDEKLNLLSLSPSSSSSSLLCSSPSLSSSVFCF